jgi:hypothetical protein
MNRLVHQRDDVTVVKTTWVVIADLVVIKHLDDLGCIMHGHVTLTVDSFFKRYVPTPLPEEGRVHAINYGDVHSTLRVVHKDSVTLFEGA